MAASSPRDVFLRLFSVVTLYITAVAFGVLVFQYIDVLFPDPLDYSYFMGVASTIRGAMAALIIVFPMCLYLARFLHNEERVNIEKRESLLRNWLIYLTLFVAASVATGDLIGLVHYFLEGDLTTRFALKMLVMLGISGTIFAYYFSLVRAEWSRRSLNVFAVVVSLLIFGSIVFGFFTVGSPLLARKLRFDERRVNDLQSLQGSIVNYWQQKNKLPDTLAVLRDDISGYVNSPTDPATQLPYEYRILALTQFELCATFALASRVGDGAHQATPYPYFGESWDHDAGRFCFARTIDPELYKPNFPSSVKLLNQ